MPEWLTAAIPTENELPTAVPFGHLIRDAALGAAVASIYYLTQRTGRSDAAPFVATLVLLTVLIGMVTHVIGDNVARAFSLAGALAITRCRTVVDDTRDTAFVIAAVVAGMAAGAGMLGVALGGLPILAATSGLLALWAGGYTTPVQTGRLVVRAGIGPGPAERLAPLLGKYLTRVKLVAAGTTKQETVIELTNKAAMKPGVTAAGLVLELTQMEGVQSVD